ncbi:hypothetical protein AURDEDRAFT_169746, partial [Auricularia subglabra TFB-10046 SS5]
AEPQAHGECEAINVDADPEVIVIDDDDDDYSHVARDEDADIARAIELSLLHGAIDDDDDYSHIARDEDADIARAIELSLLHGAIDSGDEDSRTARDEDAGAVRAFKLSLSPAGNLPAQQDDDDDDDDDPYVEDEDLCRALKLSRWAARMKSRGAGPSRLEPSEESAPLKIRVTCEHLWKANPVRDSGSAIYRTTVTVPSSRGEEGDFFESDFTDEALAALKLTRKLLKRVLIWDDSRVHYLLAYPEEDDDPTDACFALEVKYSAKHRITFLMNTKIEELESHVELKEEERRRDEEHEWDSLNHVLARVEVRHYEKKGYCEGNMVVKVGDCRAPRRRWHIEHCMLSLRDFCENDLMVLGLADADLSVTDDGDYRPSGITMDTLLNAEPWTSDYDDQELKIVIRVHGSAVASPKRRRLTCDDQEKEDARANKRGKTA